MGSPTPWKEDKWLPGVLNYSQMQQLVECGLIQKANGKNGRDDSALDLHLSNEAFKMKKGSIKPFGKINYSEIIRDPYYGEPLPKEDDGTFILRINCCYVFKISMRSLHQEK